MCLQPGNAIPSELNAPNAHLWFQLWLQGMVFKLFTSGYAVWSFTSFGISNMVLTLEEHYMWETHGQEWEESTLRGRRWRKWISRTALVPVTARLFHEASVCSVVFDSLRPWTVAFQAPMSMGFSRKSTGVGCHSFLQGIFWTQGSNLHLLYCRQIL